MGLNNILNIYVLCLVTFFIKYTSKVNGYYLSDSNEILIENGYKYNTSEILHKDVEITDSIREIDQNSHKIDNDNDDDDDSLLNKNTMDLITIVWYFSTFLALVAFFIVMACSDNHCGRQKPEEPAEPPPPTPAPSYREFAPPNYDSIMEKNRERIFVIPIFNTKSADIDIEVGVEITNETTVNQNESQTINVTSSAASSISSLTLSTSSLPTMETSTLSTTSSITTTSTTPTPTFVQSSTTIEIPR